MSTTPGGFKIQMMRVAGRMDINYLAKVAIQKLTRPRPIMQKSTTMNMRIHTV